MNKNIKDLTGEKFSHLTVIGLSSERKHGCTSWDCVCDCGNTTTVATGDLVSGNTKSCGGSIHRIKDISGQRFGKLLVLELSEVVNHASLWKCICDCGNETVVSCHSLTTGNTRSCGCLHRDVCYKGPGVSHRHQRYLKYIDGAGIRGYSFELSEEEFNEITNQACFYCGSFDKYNGIDRVDNSKGYITDNVVPCCRNCNTAKGSVTIEMARKMLDFVDNK